MKISLARAHLERIGYKDITMREAELYALAGPKDFYKVIDYAFREAYWICKYLEIMPGDSNFNPTFRQHRENAVEESLKLFREGHGDYLPLYVLTDQEIVKSINGIDEVVVTKEPKALKAG